MLKNLIMLLLIMTAVVLKPFSAFAASFDEYPQIYKEYICAFMSLAAYDDRIGLTARDELVARGWELMQYRNEQQKTDAKFYYAKQIMPDGAPVYLLAVTGTESKKDINIDLKIGKVYFAGKTKEEFAENAANHKVTAKEPQVHGGFNDYTQAAFFAPQKDGRVVGDFLYDRLTNNPEARLCITGHSLGGAVALLLGARLVALGIPPEQIDIITFGAPAVGNAAFVAECEELKLDRVVIAGDPVRGILQVLGAGYKQFEQATSWKSNRNAELFKHSMAVYLDAALRAYYDQKTSFPHDAETRPDIYSVIKINLNSAIESDRIYMERAVKDYLQTTENGRVVFAENPEESLRVHLDAAAKAGCKYIIVQEFTGNVMKDKRDSYTIELQETIFDEVGNLIGGFAATTGTKRMTPIEGVLYDIVYARKDREEIVRR